MLVTGLVACSSKPPSASPTNASIVVFAAASLRPAFTRIKQQFKHDNPGDQIEFDFAGSSELATQLTQGATADVFASADTAQMDTVAKAGLLAGESDELRVQHLGHRYRAGQPEENRILRRPRQTGPEGGDLPAAGAVRVGDPADRGQHRGAPQRGQRGTQRDRCPQQGHQRSGRRRSGLCHRRQQRRRPGHHRQLSRGRRCGERLSHRGAEGRPEPGGGAEVRGPW